MPDDGIKEALDRNLRLKETFQQASFEYDGQIANALMLVSSFFLATQNSDNDLYSIIFTLFSISIISATTAHFLLRHGIRKSLDKLISFFMGQDQNELDWKVGKITEADYMQRTIDLANDKKHLDVVALRRRQFEFCIWMSVMSAGMGIVLSVLTKIST